MLAVPDCDEVANCEGVIDGVLDCDEVEDGVENCDELRVPEAVASCDKVPDALGVNSCDGVNEGVLTCDGVTDGVAICDELRVPETVASCVAVPDPLDVAAWLALCEKVRDCVVLGVGDCDSVMGLRVEVGVSEPDPVGVGVAAPDPLWVADFVGVWDRVADAEFVGTWVVEGVPVADGVVGLRLEDGVTSCDELVVCERDGCCEGVIEREGDGNCETLGRGRRRVAVAAKTPHAAESHPLGGEGSPWPGQ